MVRWSCASALRPSPSRLPPGADNKAQEAKKREEKRAEGYPAGTSLKLVERHGQPAAIARHEDGDGAAIRPIEEAHAAWRLRLCPPRVRRFAKDSRLRENVNASRSDDGPGDDGPGPAGGPSTQPVVGEFSADDDGSGAVMRRVISRQWADERSLRDLGP